MKFFLVVLLLLALSANLKAELKNEIEEFASDDVELDGNDKCRVELKLCLKDAKDNFKEKLECYFKFRKCVSNRPRPTRPRPSGGPRPTIPPHIVQCQKELKKCRIAAGDSIKDKIACMVKFKKCVLANRPSKRPKPAFDEDARRPHPSGRPSGRPRPTRPAFVVQCQKELRKCLEDADTIKDRLICVGKFRMCLKNNRPSRRPRPSGRPSRRPRPSGRPSRRPRPTRPAFVVQCRMQLKKCFEEAGDDMNAKRECKKKFRMCLKNNRPSRRPRPSGRPSRRPRPSGRPSRRPRPSGRPSRGPPPRP